MSKSRHFLVVEPGLTYLALGQRITQRYLNQVYDDYLGLGEFGITIAPYSQKLQRHLDQQRKIQGFWTNKKPKMGR